MAAGMTLVANLNTFWPFMYRAWRGAPAATRSVTSSSTSMGAVPGSVCCSASASMPSAVNGWGAS